MYQPSYYQTRIKVTKLTRLLSLTVNFVNVGSQSCLIGLPQRCQNSVSSAHMQTKWLYSRDLMFCCRFSFTILSLMFFLLFPKVFTDILKIYKLPKIRNKIPKYFQTPVLTITIYQVNFIFQLHLAFELYPCELY